MANIVLGHLGARVHLRVAWGRKSDCARATTRAQLTGDWTVVAMAPMSKLSIVLLLIVQVNAHLVNKM